MNETGWESLTAAVGFAGGFSQASGPGRHSRRSGVSRCKLLHLEWINSKVLLYSIGDYIQYPGINHNGK